MPRDYIPSKDADFLAWGNNYSTIISAGPTALGLTTGNATALATYQSAFADALEAATNPATRGGATILAKDTARDALESYCRKLAMAIQGTLTVTDQQKYELGLTVRDVAPTPVPPPDSAPAIDQVSMIGHVLTIRLHEAGNSTRRGRPIGVQGSSVFSFVGATPPLDVASWVFQGSTSKTTFDIAFDSSLAPGTKVWVTAFWCNSKLQSGPAADPVSALIQFGGMSQAA